MTAAIISIGDELLIGQVINTNAAFISRQLGLAGVDVRRVVTVADELDQILHALEEEFSRHDLTVVTGGLGPTHDDITRTAMCRFFRTDLVRNPVVRRHIEQWLESRGRSWNDAAENQTMVPRGAIIMPNRVGTAPGEIFEESGKLCAVMPGVPYEMEAMVTESLLPFLRKRGTGGVVVHRTLRTTGIAESVLAERLGDLDQLLQGTRLAFLPSPSGVRLRITLVGTDAKECEESVRSVEARIRAKVEKFIFGTDEEDLETVVGRILEERHMTVSVAESCTGGLIAHLLTNVPGSSRYFERGVVAYSNLAKTHILSVPESDLRAHGAVSSRVAEAMADGIRRLSDASIGISTTGIAGPSGGTKEKPVGLVWIGYADKSTVFSREFRFGNDRLRTKERAAYAALELMRRHVLGIT